MSQLESVIGLSKSRLLSPFAPCRPVQAHEAGPADSGNELRGRREKQQKSKKVKPASRCTSETKLTI